MQLADHIDDQLIARALAGALPPGQVTQIIEHGQSCATCRARLESSGIATGAPATMSLEGRPAVPDGLLRVGRYLIVERLGAGGMGVVYSAYDPELDRRIAVKVLRLRPGRPAGPGTERLLREAQAMARLSHPNVIAVHDVGPVDDGVFFAMERVDGGTLRDWLKQQHGWREVLAVFAQAGRGLAAAHAVGIVHRDFKPENVLMGKDGRVRVTDFGIARAVEVAEEEVPARGGEAGSLGPQLTRAGQVMGTPGYLAPEQLDGPVSPQTDQFSFCVALYEALTGARPFKQTSFDAYTDSLRTARVTFPATSEVPGFVREVVLRGLEKDPARRFTSMDALLETLARDPRARRIRLLAGATVAALLVIAGGATLARRAADQAAARRACDQAAGQAQARRDGRQAQIASTFGSIRRPFAADALRTVQASLGNFAREWGQARRSVCLGETTLPPQQRPASALCLDHALTTMDQTAALLARGDATVVQNAPQMVAALPPVRDCLDLASLQSAPPPPSDPQTAAAVASARARLALAQILAIPRPQEGVDQVRPLLAELERLGYAPGIAEASFVLGELQQKVDPRSGAEGSLLRAARLAFAGRDDRLFARAAGRLAFVVGGHLGQVKRGEDWLVLARQAHERAGRPAALGAWLDLQEAGSLVMLGPWDRCIQVAQRALAGAQKLGDSLQEAEATFLLVLCSSMSRPADEILRAAERALELYRGAFGPNHPETSTAMSAVGYYRWCVGDAAGALPEIEASLASVRALIASSPEFADAMRMQLAATLSYRVNALADLGRHREAVADAQEALAVLGKGPRPPSVMVDLLSALVISTRQLGRSREAWGHLQEALKICAKPDEALAQQGNCTFVHDAHARLLLDRGQRAEAASQGARARDGYAAIPLLHRQRDRVEAWARQAGLTLPAGKS